MGDKNRADDATMVKIERVWVTHCATHQTRGGDSFYNGIEEHDESEDSGWVSLREPVSIY